MDQVFIRFEADYDVVLECIQEVYGLEGDNLRLEKIFGGIQMENLHKVLWEVYQESTGGIDFLEKADIILKPYYREIQSLEQNVYI